MILSGLAGSKRNGARTDRLLDNVGPSVTSFGPLQDVKPAYQRVTKLSSNCPEAALYRHLSLLIVRQTRWVAPLTRSHHFGVAFGVTWIRAPGFASSSNHSEPSGACSTSRIRLPTFQRSAVLAPPLPSKMMRFRVFVARPLIKPLPSHCGKVLVPR